MNSRSCEILFVNRLFGIRFGGGENFDFRLAANLAISGHSVTILTGISRNGTNLHPRPTGVEFRYLRSPYLRWLMYRFEAAKLRPLRWIGYSGRICDLALFQLLAFIWILAYGRRFQAVQLCGMPGLAATLQLLGWNTTVRWPGPPGKIDIYFSNFCGHVIAGGDVYPGLHGKIRPEILRNLEVGVDLSSILPKSWHEPVSCTRFLFVGRIVPIKNLENLLKAFAIVTKLEPGLTLEFAGTGDADYIAYLHALIRQLGIQAFVNFVGPKKPTEISTIYRHYDCLCLVSNYENFPNVILEAMAAGLPIIASNVGGIVKQVTSGINGILINPDDSAALADAILQFARNPGQCRKIGNQNRQQMLASRTWTDVAADWLALNAASMRSYL